MTKIQASMILEILGRPPEHIKESLNTVVVKIGSEKGVNIINKTYHEPKKVEDSKDLYTAFAEVDVELDSLANYFGILFAYLPAHMEITHPEKLTLQNSDLNELGNALIQRLHGYDAVVKKVLAERQMIEEKLKEIAPQLFKKIPPQQDKEPSTKKKAKTKKTKKKSAKKKSL